MNHAGQAGCQEKYREQNAPEAIDGTILRHCFPFAIRICNRGKILRPRVGVNKSVFLIAA